MKPWQSKDPDLRDVIRCPKCKTSRPAFRSVELTSYWPSEHGTIEKVTGYRVHCQECPAIYSIDAFGVVFDAHEQSLPLTPRPQVAHYREDPDPPDDDRSRSLPPIPIKRPRP
jgi:hypothetical protein